MLDREYAIGYFKRWASKPQFKYLDYSMEKAIEHAREHSRIFYPAASEEEIIACANRVLEDVHYINNTIYKDKYAVWATDQIFNQASTLTIQEFWANFDRVYWRVWPSSMQVYKEVFIPEIESYSPRGVYQTAA